MQGFEKGYSRFACERKLETERNWNILTPKLWSPNSIGVPEGPLGRVWLSLPHLVSNWPGTPTLLATQLARQIQLTYIIVRRPLDLWNWLFKSSLSGNNCHAVPRSLSSGASLCSGTLGPSPCPILSALIRPRDLIQLLAIGMCHFLPVHHLGIAFLGRVEGQNITLLAYGLPKEIVAAITIL